MSDEERRLALAEHYLEIGRPAEAYRAVQELGAEPSERAWLVAAESLRRLERYEEAADAALSGLEHEPDSVPLLDSLALSQQELGDVAAAERSLRTALALWPDHAGLLRRYGHLLARTGQLDRARLIATEVERGAPDDADTQRLRLAIAYVAHGRGAAARIGRDVLALEPEDAAAHRSLAVHAAERGDLATAARHMEEVVRQDPGDREAAEVARDFRMESHWLLAPLWPFRRFGPWKVLAAAWISAAALAGLNPTLGGVFILLYGALVLYSWLVPPLVRSHLRGRSR